MLLDNPLGNIILQEELLRCLEGDAVVNLVLHLLDVIDFCI
jgi:hypothetical protein